MSDVHTSEPRHEEPAISTDANPPAVILTQQNPSVSATEPKFDVETTQLQPGNALADNGPNSRASTVRNDASPQPQEPPFLEFTPLPPPPRRRPVMTKAQFARLPAEQRAAFAWAAPSSSTQPSTSSSIPSISLPDGKDAKAWKKSHKRQSTFGSVDFLDLVDSEDDSEDASEKNPA